MKTEMLTLLHEGHHGMSKMKSRATESMYWPRMKYDIEMTCAKCATCNKYKRQNQREPLKQHDLPQRPFQKVGVDIFEYEHRDFILCVDYYSKFVEIRRLSGKSAKAIKPYLSAIFAVHGIPEEVIADNMPFNSSEFRQFAQLNNFTITTTSPTHSQSNGLAERTIQTVKQLIKKAYDSGKDESIALLEYRNTPITGCDYSPAQLLFNRRLRDKLPTTAALLEPCVPVNARQQLLKCQERQKFYYDKHAKPLKGLQEGDSVRYRKGKSWEPAVVVNEHSSPRSYNITTDRGINLRRNRVHLQRTTQEPTPQITNEDYDDLPINDPTSRQQDTQDRPNAPTNTASEPHRILRPREAIRKPARYRDSEFVN